MQYRKLNSLDVSEICLGTMQFRWLMNEEDSYKLLDAFVEQGGNFIDTADMYTQWAQGLVGGEAETILGNWMQKKKNRQKIVLATKVRCRMWDGPDGEGLSRTHIMRACDDSLRRLKTDYIDLYQSHWSDQKTPIEETLAAYQTLVKQGKVRHIGCSNYSADDMNAAHKAGKEIGAQYISVQPYYNLIGRNDFEKNILPIVIENKMAVIPYSPLAAGFLTGKYRKGKPVPESVRADQIKKEKMTEKNLALIETMDAMGKTYGKTVLQMALGWLLAHDWMTAPIVGANSIAQLNESFGAVGLKLSPQDKKKLDDLTV